MPVPIYRVVQVLKGLRGELPMDVWSFVQKFGDVTGCKLSLAEGTLVREVIVSEDVRVYVYAEQLCNVVCNDQPLPIPPALINVMYIHNTKSNIKYVAGYEVVV
jgi:hypothetical protein